MSDDRPTTGTAVLQAQPEAPAETTTKRILLLDGVRLFLQLEQTLLQRSDYELFTATSGAEALEIVERERLDLVLLDYVLPDTTGDEVVRRIRSDERNGEAGIVIVTARGMREHVDKCMAAGCSAFLYKPVTRTSLCARVQDMLQVPARRHVRTLVRLQVNARNRERFFFGNTVNLSESGMLLETPLDLSLGETMSIRFFLPGEDEAVACTARVTRRTPTQRPGNWAYGLSFEELGDDSRTRICGFVQAQESVAESVC
jgi:CheY-like chemotaxis protein